jgi:hypothetical protein
VQVEDAQSRRLPRKGYVKFYFLCLSQLVASKTRDKTQLAVCLFFWKKEHIVIGLETKQLHEHQPNEASDPIEQILLMLLCT